MDSSMRWRPVTAPWGCRTVPAVASATMTSAPLVHRPGEIAAHAELRVVRMRAENEYALGAAAHVCLSLDESAFVLRIVTQNSLK